jgi:hypothetical protein
LIKDLPQAVSHLWLDVGLNHVGDERLEPVMAVLEEGGVYALLGYDRDLLDALSLLGAIAPTMPYLRRLLGELERRGFTDPEGTVRGLAACAEMTGFAVLRSDGTQVRVHV